MLYYEGNSLRNLPMYHNNVLIMFCNPIVFYCLVLRNRIVMLSKTNWCCSWAQGKVAPLCLLFLFCIECHFSVRSPDLLKLSLTKRPGIKKILYYYFFKTGFCHFHFIDLEEMRECTLKFLGDTKMMRKIDMLEDVAAMQMDLNRLEEWATEI